jgi:hypothetical protein
MSLSETHNLTWLYNPLTKFEKEAFYAKTKNTTSIIGARGARLDVTRLQAQDQ